MKDQKIKRPKDPVELAKLIGDIATGAVEDKPEKLKNPRAVESGQRGGLKGGNARSKKLTPERRKEIAQKAAKKRWAMD